MTHVRGDGQVCINMSVDPTNTVVLSHNTYPTPPHHSVLIPDNNIDNTMTLYRLRRASGRPLDFMCYTGQPNNT
jgi:hypothetical protein